MVNFMRMPFHIHRRFPASMRSWLGKIGIARHIGNTLVFSLDGALAGCRMRGEGIGIYLSGDYEPRICEAIRRIVGLGWTCVDLGAHKGYFTLLMAKLVGNGGRVFTFEAHHGNARTVEDNVTLNQFRSRVCLENLAVSDGTKDVVLLYKGRDKNSSEWNIIGHDASGQRAQPFANVKAVALDQYFSPETHVDFVKIDIEGAEGQALVGMRRILRESLPIMLIEFHYEEGWETRAELLGLGYHLFDLQKGKWIDPLIDIARVYHCLAVPERRLKNLDLSFLTTFQKG